MDKQSNTSKKGGKGVKSVLGTIGSIVFAPLALPGVRILTKSLIKGGLYVTGKSRYYIRQSEDQWIKLWEEAREEVRGSNKDERQAEATSKSGSSFAETDFDSWHIDELHKYARELDIKGRSNMNKAELIEAINRTQED